MVLIGWETVTQSLFERCYPCRESNPAYRVVNMVSEVSELVVGLAELKLFVSGVIKCLKIVNLFKVYSKNIRVGTHALRDRLMNTTSLYFLVASSCLFDPFVVA